MKQILCKLIILFLITSCAVRKNNSKEIFIEIKTDKRQFNKNNKLDLFVNFVNNSDKEITILKPSTEYGPQMDFFSLNILNCYKESGSITGISFGEPIIERTESDLITIKAKSKVELKISGYLYGLFCNSSNNVNIKLLYDSKRIPKLNMNEFNEIQYERVEILYKKLTRIKVKSRNTKIELK
jgi:hypothetical protein